MARIALATFGSLGDLHPFLALASALRARGHTCIVLAAASYRERIERVGAAFAPLSPDVADLVQREAIGRKGMHPREGSRWLVQNLVAPAIRANADELLAACRGADVLVNSTLVVAAQPVTEVLGIPRVAVTLQPQTMFSMRDASIYPQFRRLSRWLRGHAGLNRHLHRAMARASLEWFAPLADVRRRLGLTPEYAHPVFEAWSGAATHLALFSRHFAPDPGDWDARAVQTGFAFHDAPAEGPPLPEATARFLDAGPAPVVFTLGSAAVWARGAFYEHAREAVRALGVRAVLLAGDVPLAPQGPDPAVHIAPYAAYSALFPRAAAVVSSAGIGTVAQGLRAGRPMLLVPWAHDQFDNAERFARLGAGRVLDRGALGGRALAAALGALLADGAAAERAGALGGAIRAEDGAGAAAKAILQRVGG